MQRIFLFLLGLCLQVQAYSSSTILKRNNTEAGLKSVAYYINSDIYDRKYYPQNLPVNHLTHILYGFADIRPDTGEVILSDLYADITGRFPSDSLYSNGTDLYGCMKQLFLLKQKHRTVKVLLSIGGDVYSQNFGPAASTADGQQRFAQSAVQLLQDLGLDGLDINWKYPTGDFDAKNFVSLLSETRKALDKYAMQSNGTYLLTVAGPGDPAYYQMLHINDMVPYVDFWNLMAYDYVNSTSALAGHQANLFNSKEFPKGTPLNTSQAIAYYIQQNVSSRNLVLGIPLYGRAFTNTDGPGQPFTGVGGGSWEEGVWDYKDLPKAGAIVREDEPAFASYSYDATNRIMVSYDTPQMAEYKASAIILQSLGGAMWWESSGDKAGNDSIIQSVVNTFGGPLSKSLDSSLNTISYPASVYDNLRKGFPNE